MIVEKVVSYICEICGTSFSKKKDALKCDQMSIETVDAKRGDLIEVNFTRGFKKYQGLGIVVNSQCSEDARVNSGIDRIMYKGAYHHYRRCLVSLGFSYGGNLSSYCYNEILYPCEIAGISTQRRKILIKDYFLKKSNLQRRLSAIDTELAQNEKKFQGLSEYIRDSDFRYRGLKHQGYALEDEKQKMIKLLSGIEDSLAFLKKEKRSPWG